MGQRRRLGLLALALTVGLIAAACGSSSGGSDGASGSDTTAAGGSDAKFATCEGKTGEKSTAAPLGAKGDADGAGKKIGMVFDVGGKGDFGFNDSAYAGIEAAVANMGIDAKELEPNADGTNRGELMRSLADEGYQMIIGVGFAFADDMTKIAKDYPKVTFAIVDGVVDLPNVTSLLFAAEQGSYLVGAEAALKSKAGTIGFVGGVNGELIQTFQAGFEAGAKAAVPDIKIESKYISPDGDFSGFDDAAKGKTIAAGLYEAGADVVFAAAGKSGLGVFEAATEANRLAIGVDSDQYLTAEPAQQKCIMSSMLKRVDVAVYNAIKDFVGGSLKAGIVQGDLTTGAVGYATTGGQVVDQDKVDGYAADIKSGKITVPTKP